MGGRRQGRGSEAALLLSGGFGEAAWPWLPRKESSPAACCWGTLALGAVSGAFQEGVGVRRALVLHGGRGRGCSPCCGAGHECRAGPCPLGSVHLKLCVSRQEEMVFYYYSNCSISVGRYRDRVQWQGDISRWDGSIQLRGVQVNDSGRYLCEMRLLQHSSIFKNHTVLQISPMARTGTCPTLPPLTSHPSDPSESLPELPPGFLRSSARSLRVPAPALVSPQQVKKQRVPRALRSWETAGFGL